MPGEADPLGNAGFAETAHKPEHSTMARARHTGLIATAGVLSLVSVVGLAFAQSGGEGNAGDQQAEQSAQQDQPDSGANQPAGTDQAQAEDPAAGGANDQPASGQGNGGSGGASNGGADANGNGGNANTPSSEQVMEQLLKQRDAQSVEPTESAGEQGDDQPRPDESVDMPAAGVKSDQSVLGVAPEQNKGQPTLKREGAFIVNRRGHLARAKESNRLMFVFDADKKESPEPPMVLQACRTLETMEKIVQKRGESVDFIISGQVHTYRNQNYLMPTMMKIAENSGNLK